MELENTNTIIEVEAKKAIQDFNIWLENFLYSLPESTIERLNSFIVINTVLDFVKPVMEKGFNKPDTEIIKNSKEALQKLEEAVSIFLKSSGFDNPEDMFLQREVQKRKRIYIEYCIKYLGIFFLNESKSESNSA